MTVKINRLARLRFGTLNFAKPHLDLLQEEQLHEQKTIQDGMFVFLWGAL